MRSPTASTPRATGGRGVRYARGPRRMLCSHDFQRASRKLSVHAVALCVLCSPLYCPGATRPRQACSRSSYLTLSGCQLLSQGGPGVRLARHRRRRQALYATRGGRGVRYARTIFNAHHVSQAYMHAVVLCASCPPLYCPGAMRPRQACSQSSYLTLPGSQLLSQGGPGM